MVGTEVLHSLREICLKLQPGDALPTRVELIRRFGASERAVRWALDELEREGRIIRRQGAGTFIAESGVSSVSGPILPRTMTDSRTVVAISAPDHAIFERAMALLFRHATDAGLSLACRLVDPDNFSQPVPRLESSDHPLGYVLFGRVLLPLAERLHQAGHRTVFVGNPYAGTESGVPTVQGNQELGGYLATRHLLELGHRRIAFLGLTDVVQTQRWRGHQRALGEARRRGIAVEDCAPIHEDQYGHWQRMPESAKAYFQRPDAPTAIVVWNDHEAVTLLSLLSFIGVRVPQDVSVIGYDNLPEGQRVHPQLSTVDGAIEQQLQAAVDILARPVPPSPSHNVIVLPSLVSRDSTAPIPT